jgi:hypothetical protein
MTLVHRLAYNGDVVASKMGRRQGGPSRTGVGGRIPHQFDSRLRKTISAEVSNGCGSNRRATQPPAHFQRNPPGRRSVGCFSALLARPV